MGVVHAHGEPALYSEFGTAFQPDRKLVDSAFGKQPKIVGIEKQFGGFNVAETFPDTAVEQCALKIRAEKNAFDCIRFSVGFDKGAKALFCHVGCGVARIKMLIVLIEVDRFHFLLRRV